jgi:LPXTG-motif cell wall-anchored protein
MKKARWVSVAAGTAVLVAGFALPATAAFADGGGDGNGGVLSVLSGNDVNAPVSVPVDVCGVAVALLGGADGGCAGGAVSNTTVNDPNGGGNGNGNAGVISAGSGNTVNSPVSVPVNVCGVAGAAGGFSNAGCKGGAASSTTINNGSGGNGNGNAGDISALSGSTVNSPVSVPANVCGIAVALLGFSNASCVGGAASNTTINGGGGGNGNGNAGVISAGSGNTVNSPVSVPVNVCGVSAAVAGFSNASCQGGSVSTVGTPPTSPAPGQTTPPPPCQCTTPPSTPPGHHHHGHTPPGGTTPPGTPPGGTSPHGGTGPGSGAGSTTTTVPGSLPITGANILGMLVAALGALGIGGASLVIARRRRNSEAS